MKEITLTQGKKMMVDDEDFGFLSKIKWCAIKRPHTFYAWGTLFGKRVIAHRLIANPSSGKEVDHIDGDGLNNQRSNLRMCTHNQNGKSRRKNKTYKSSEFKGVTGPRNDCPGKPWAARIVVNYKHIWLGLYASKEEAARAYDRAAKKHYGEFAKTNF